MAPRRVQIWFQNRRAKERRKTNGEEDGESDIDSEDIKEDECDEQEDSNHSNHNEHKKDSQKNNYEQFTSLIELPVPTTEQLTRKKEKIELPIMPTIEKRSVGSLPAIYLSKEMSSLSNCNIQQTDSKRRMSAQYLNESTSEPPYKKQAIDPLAKTYDRRYSVPSNFYPPSQFHLRERKLPTPKPDQINRKFDNVDLPQLELLRRNDSHFTSTVQNGNSSSEKEKRSDSLVPSRPNEERRASLPSISSLISSTSSNSHSKNYHEGKTSFPNPQQHQPSFVHNSTFITPRNPIEISKRSSFDFTINSTEHKRIPTSSSSLLSQKPTATINHPNQSNHLNSSFSITNNNTISPNINQNTNNNNNITYFRNQNNIHINNNPNNIIIDNNNSNPNNNPNSNNNNNNLLNNKKKLPILSESVMNIYNQIQRAVEEKNISFVKNLLGKISNVDLRCYAGTSNWNLIHSAVKIGDDAMVQLLVDTNQLDVNAQEITHKYTPLHIASLEGKTSTVAILASRRNCNLNVLDNFQRTPLFCACASGHIDCVAELLNYLNFVDIPDRNGTTPLQIAAKHGYTTIVKLLVNRGANVNIRDNNNQTALHYAVEQCHKDICIFLSPLISKDPIPNSTQI